MKTLMQGLEAKKCRHWLGRRCGSFTSPVHGAKVVRPLQMGAFAQVKALNGRFGLENVAHLEKLPARGFHVIVAPIKIEGGTGGPVRLFAVLR